MIEYYAEFRLVHVGSVVASGLLFLLRGTLVQLGRDQWAMAAGPRYLSYAIDTALLTAALGLVSMLPSAAFGNGWLIVKLVLLPVYVVCGWLSLRSARGPGPRLAFFSGAVTVYATMFTVARLHDPLGPFRLLVPN